MTAVAAARDASPRNWGAIAALAAIGLVSLALSLHALAHLRDAAIALTDAGRAIRAADLAAALDATDLGLAAATLAAIAVTATWEVRAHAVSRLVTTITPAQSFVLLTLIIAWCGQAYLFSGVLLGGDTGTHIARFLEMRRGFEAGRLAEWTNYDFLGSPLLEFTGPFTYVVGGALDVIVRDPVVTAKILLFTTHIIAAWVFYALLRRLQFALLPALVATIGFAGSFALLHLFLFRGVFPQQFTIIFLVLVFYAAEGLMRGLPGLAGDWLVFALATAGLIINHQPHALFGGLYLGLFGAASLAVGRWQWSGLKWLVSAGVLGVAIAIFAVLPIIVEADWVMIDPEGGLLRLRLPALERLTHLVLWRNTRTTWGFDYWAYLGIASIALALLGAWAAFSRRLGDARRALALALLPGLVLMFFLYNPVIRDVMFIAFFAGVLAALGVEYVVLVRRPQARTLLLIVLAVTLDVASTSIQPVARTDKQFMIDAGRYLESHAATDRVLEVYWERDGSYGVNIGPNAGPMSFYATVPRIAGLHDMAATLVHNYAEAAARLADTDLHRDGRLAPATETLVGLFNAARVICFTAIRSGCPASFIGAHEEGSLGAVLRIPAASPALFSRTLVELAPPPGLDKPMLKDEHFSADPPNPQIAALDGFLQRYLDVTRIDPATHRAAALAVRRLPAAAPPDAPGASDWHPRVTRYEVGLERVEMDIASNGPGYAQLAHPWYPASEVRINGQRVEPLEGSLGLMVLPLADGDNAIAIRPTVTPIRVAAAIVSALALVLTFAAAGLLGLRGITPGRRRTPHS